MATKKISELGGLGKSASTDNDVVPIVNGGATKKMTLTNLRGKLRGASNTGGSCAALVGGINNNSAGGCSAVVTGFRNTNTNGGEWIGGGQDNTVDDKSVARSLGPNNYNVPDLNGSIGSYSAILGGARNCINIVTASVYNNDYSISPSVILSGVDNVIESTATSTSNAYWPFVGQNLIAAGVSNCISGSSNSGNYPIGGNTILNGALNTIVNNASTDSNSYLYHNTILGGMCNTINADSQGAGFALVQGYQNTIQSCADSEESYYSNVTLMGSLNRAVMDGNSSVQRVTSIIGAQDSCIVTVGRRVEYTGILGGLDNHICATSSDMNGSVIIGGQANRMVDVDQAVILGGQGQCAVVDCGTHVQHLVIKSTSIPTADPGVPGQVWVDTTAGNTLKISL